MYLEHSMFPISAYSNYYHYSESQTHGIILLLFSFFTKSYLTLLAIKSLKMLISPSSTCLGQCVADSRHSINVFLKEIKNIYWSESVSCWAVSDSLQHKDCLLGSSVHGILQARILEWIAISFSRGSFWSRDRIASRFFTVWATREAQEEHILILTNSSL